MTTTATVSPLAVFDALQRGDAAPDWLASGVCDAWALDADRAEIRLIAVSENATFRIAVDGEPVGVLRVHRPGHVGETDQIEGELIWMRCVAEETPVRVPEVLAAADGRLVHTIEEGGARWFCVVFGFVTGCILEDLADPRPYYEAIGATTARLHDHAERWAPPAGFARFSWRVEDMLGATSRWGDWREAALDETERAVLERAEAAALAVIAELEHGGPGWGLVHADLRPSNIMIEGELLTVIDFDDCGFSWLLYDFASALSFIEHEPYAPDIAKRWVDGYRSVRPLDALDLQRACALSMIRRLTMLGWTTTHRADALPAELWAAQVPGTVAVARRYLDSPTWLLD